MLQGIAIIGTWIAEGASVEMRGVFSWILMIEGVPVASFVWIKGLIG